jgi:hypothetical protein
MSATVQEIDASQMASWRVAIIDDVYADPNLNAVELGLAEFCAEVSADDSMVSLLRERIKCDFTNIGNVTDDKISALYNHRNELTEIDAQLASLFYDFDQRRREVKTIEANLKANGFADENIKTFQSVQDSFSDNDPFQLVFLDLRLKGGVSESKEFAKQIYSNSKAFILLMSNTQVSDQHIEEFRHDTRLLKGFFAFREKADLCDAEKFGFEIKTLPKEQLVCHAVHDFVNALEDALGGNIEAPPIDEEESHDGLNQSILPSFMSTLRALGLHDYALLCELTLRSEGHPLGDYMMRLLGAHLLAKLLSHSKVKDAIVALDGLRFSEFLPFGDECSPSFHRMYADATTEVIRDPWSPHPWGLNIEPSTAIDITKNDAVKTGEIENISDLPADDTVSDDQDTRFGKEILNLLGIQDDSKDLPYLQLGDLLIKDESAPIFVVISAACDLQFSPAKLKKPRIRRREDTVLLVPARLCAKGSSKSQNTTAGLVEWRNNYYSVEWFSRKLLGIPHCALKKMLEERGYKHERRLQTARALELQQAVLSHVSRIGLEARPPFPREIKITLFGKHTDQSFVQLGNACIKGGLLFYSRQEEIRWLILRKEAFLYFAKEMEKHGNQVKSSNGLSNSMGTSLLKAAKEFSSNMCGVKLPIEISKSSDTKAIRLVPSLGGILTMNTVAVRFGANTTEAPSPEINRFMFCLSAEEE